MATPTKRQSITTGHGNPNTLRCQCGNASISAPPGATAKTRYVCPACAERELRRRGVDPAPVHFDEPRNEVSILRINV